MNRAIGVPFIRRRPARCAEFFLEIWRIFPPTNLFHPKESSWPPIAPANYRDYRSVAAPPRPIAGGRITLEQMVKLLTLLLTREVPSYPVSSLARKSLPSAAARHEPSSTPACLQVAEAWRAIPSRPMRLPEEPADAERAYRATSATMHLRRWAPTVSQTSLRGMMKG